MPPVTNISIPAACAAIIVAETVVAPIYLLAITYAKSLRLTFLTEVAACANLLIYY
jgi:hypothetical protein